jgi:hypothetical protein
MDRRSGAASSLALILALSLLVPAGVLAKGPPGGGGGGGGGEGGGGGHEETAGKNLSFPVIAVDGFAIAPIAAPVFGVTYAGTYPGLSAAEVAYLTANGPWYPQKTTSNAWQADYMSGSAVDVTWVDWGDSIESINPRVGYPARLEVTLYRALATPMTAYTMAVLENPSSSTELQGTNTDTYEIRYATITSSMPKLVVQHLGAIDPETLTWDGTRWVAGTVVPRVVPVTFAPELNVGGRYIYGATQGGWRPDVAGRYRITFYIPSGSGVALTDATQIGNYSDSFGAAGGEDHEGGVATPAVVPGHNLTYVDVIAASGRGGGRPRG